MANRSRNKSIVSSDPGKIMNLIVQLTDDSCAELQAKINHYLTVECEAELVLMIIVDSDRMEDYIDAVGTSCLPKKVKMSMSQKTLDLLKSKTEQLELLSNQSAEFQKLIFMHIINDHQKKHIGFYPHPDRPFSVIVCLIAPKLSEHLVPSMVSECLLYIWPTLKKAIALEYERTLKQKCQQLLRVAKRLFTQVASLETLLRMTMEQLKLLTKADQVAILLIDFDKMEFTQYFFTSKDNKIVGQRRFPMTLGLGAEVVETGSLINIKSLSDYSEFNPEIDNLPGGNPTKNILCFPIRDQTGIIGVGQMINKIGEPYFDAMDEEMALAFSIYCGTCLMHSVIYSRIQEAHIRNALANELVIYHMKVTDQEVARVLECTGFHNHPHVSNLHFSTRILPLKELPCYALKMFQDLNFINRYNLKKQKLVRFILHVKKGYRDVPYHNWTHGFSVAQWAYAAICNFKLIRDEYLTELQGFMYLVAGLVHDLDHRGTTNAFQIHGQTTLAALYSSEGSVMERHHLSSAISILNTEGCDVLEALPRRDYDRALILLKDYILATDLSNYFKNLNDYQVMSMDYQKGNKVHQAALQAILMNAADLSDQLKDWGCIKKSAAAVLTEFFRQGDAEKSRGELVATIMDRDKCFIPDLQIQFLAVTCMPLYTMLGNIIPKANLILKILENHIERWTAAKPIFVEVPATAGLSVLLSPELDNLIEQNLIEIERKRKEALERPQEEVEEEED